MSFSFSKYSGLGNDFIFVDNRALFFPADSKFIQTLCHRQEGIGADGLVLVEESKSADCKMRIFNADGSEAEMCGNALRCLYLFLHELGERKDSFYIETFERLLHIYKSDEQIACQMGKVGQIEWGIEIQVQERVLKGHFLNTGVPHVVLPVLDLAHIPILPWGSFIRHHPHFGPNGTNVNFIALNSNKEIEVRTYERGVEDETLACGTGCAASAIIGQRLFNLKTPVAVKTVQGKKLSFTFSWKGEEPTDLTMYGEASRVFGGEAPLPAPLPLPN